MRNLGSSYELHGGV